eukprot:TRINITY_DN594_c0_g1_i1.p1 TRINITY_DN594_c0_g1~~TRINITY_DN594_c0_g1_i1.p1  ORF type:complete len:262 (+),score=82.86 TRINITY_DN594_c0_g1_i1:71-787(+)
MADVADKENMEPEPEVEEKKAEDVVEPPKDAEESADKPNEPAADKPNEPAAPPAPQIKMSQLAPMGVMFALQKFNLEELGYVRHAEAAYLLVQVLCLGLLGLVYQRIQAMPESGTKLKIPEVKQLGQVVKPAIEQTPKQYDMDKFMEQAKQLVMGAVILGGVYYKWGYLMPLVLQVIMTPMQLYESPLFQLHVMQAKDVTRPFPQPNPFGLPSAPEAPAEAVADAADSTKAAEDKKDD